MSEQADDLQNLELQCSTHHYLQWTCFNNFIRLLFNGIRSVNL